MARRAAELGREVPRTPERPAGRTVPVALVVLTLLTFGRLCAMDFTGWDDAETVWRNPHLTPPTAAGVGHYWTHPHMGLYVPVTYTVWSGLAAVAGVGTPDAQGVRLNPWVFHTANVVLHTVNVLLVYGILRRLVGREWAAGMGAAVFAVHPVQVEAVGWVSGMKDLLCGTFVLGAVGQYVEYAIRRRDGAAGEERGGRGRYWLGAGLMLLGMLSKPTAVVTPVIALALDWWVVGRPLRVVVRSLGWWFALAVPCVVWTKMVQTGVGVETVAWWLRPLVATDALAFYLGKLVWPAELGIDYGRRPTVVVVRGWAYWTWVAPVAVGIVLWAGRKRWPVLVGAGMVFVAGVGPVLGLSRFMFQKVSTVADHYLYLSMLGVAVAVAWAVSGSGFSSSGFREGGGRSRGWITAAVAGVVVAALAVRSFVQAGVWADDVALFSNAVEVNPESAVGHLNLGKGLAEQGRAEGVAGLEERAIGHYRRAVELRPDDPQARHNLGWALVERGAVDEGIEQLRDAVELAAGMPAEVRRGVPEARVALGSLMLRRGRHAEAAGQFRAALAERPGYAEAAAGLAEAERLSQCGAATGPAATTRRASE